MKSDVLISGTEYLKTHPRFIWFSELKKNSLKQARGTTLGYLVPKNLLYEMNEFRTMLEME